MSLGYDDEDAAAILVSRAGYEDDYRDSSSEDSNVEDDDDDEDGMDADEDPRDVKIRDLERRLKTAYQKSRRRKEKIEKLQITTKKMVRNFLKQHFSPSWVNWLLGTAQKKGKGKRPRLVREWGHEEICRCLVLRKRIGTKNYNFMRKGPFIKDILAKCLGGFLDIPSPLSSLQSNYHYGLPAKIYLPLH